MTTHRIVCPRLLSFPSTLSLPFKSRRPHDGSRPCRPCIRGAVCCASTRTISPITTHARMHEDDASRASVGVYVRGREARTGGTGARAGGQVAADLMAVPRFTHYDHFDRREGACQSASGDKRLARAVFRGSPCCGYEGTSAASKRVLAHTSMSRLVKCARCTRSRGRDQLRNTTSALA